MPLSLRELLELERQRRARVDQAFGGIADAVRSIATASSRIEESLRGWFPAPPALPASPEPPVPIASSAPARAVADVPATAWTDAVRKLDELVDESNAVATRLLGVVDIADQLDRRLGAAREIAERIDLLALNAALDATRSDPGTRGVARSASEIRDQVVRWIRATQDIAPLANEIREEVGRAVLAADATQRRAASARHDAETASGELAELTAAVHSTLDSATRNPATRGTAVAAAPATPPAPSTIGAAADPTLEHAEVIATELRALGSRLETLLLGSRS